MRIALDAMGGDYAPLEVVKGALEALREIDHKIILVGDRE
ncbi:MAG: phosphate--acyl-ACP acyltransferase, partial [Deferribacteres bacterium]|nr:phosphate--acyl-ACP acyltransferase [Deferribacteres bacterium]